MAGSMDAVWLRRIKSPGAETIAILFGLEALARGTASAVLPIDTVRLLGSDEAVSLCVLAGSAVAIPSVFAAPALARRFGRATLLSLSCIGGGLAAILFALDLASAQVLGFILRALGVALVSVCLNLFVMDYVRRGDLGRSEPLRMLSLGTGWFVGPMIGVALSQYVSSAAPYYFSAAAMLALMLLFWALRFRSAPGVRPTTNRKFRNPLASLGAFMRDRRLLHAWLNATGRGFFWMSFFIYTPIYAVNTGLGEFAAGALLSLGAGGMMGMPLWGWLTRQFGIRRIAMLTFGAAAVGCLGAWGFSHMPYLGAAGILAAALAMAVNDGYGNALFFRACRPSQRTEMTPAFTTYRDVAEIGHAAIFAVLLSLLPIEIVYLVLALILAALSILSRTVHPRL
ncbi:MAG: MFS transporter [Alphaproteobacteria bacterium]|nr:MFS transporter [Alphaproteobacteria bacterium]